MGNVDKELKPNGDLDSTTEKINPTQQVAKSKNNKKQLVKYILALIIGLVIIGSAAGATYLWRDKTAKDFEKTLNSDISALKRAKASLEKQIAGGKDGEVGDCPTPCSEIAPAASVIENIQLSITSANTAALEGYMASNVNVILAASEAYGVQTPTQAIADISSFLSDDINSWDYNFLLPTATLKTYQQGGYAKYFSATSVVGKASNNQVISFSFDCQGKIDTVFLAGNANLL